LINWADNLQPMTTSRRNFLRNLSIGSLTAIALPAVADGAMPKRITKAGSSETFTAPAGEPDEKYWAGVKSQFRVPPDRVMLNAANLCPSPVQIYDAVSSYQTRLSGDVSMQYRAVFIERRKKSIELLAKFIGAETSELGITRNTSESNCTIVHGIELQRGDEIILWDQNHPSNKEVWQKRAARDGIVIKLVSVPANPSAPEELLSPFANAFTAKTKIIAFSHVSNVSGISLPAKELCSLARSKGVLSLIDGAQTLGFHEVNVKDLGCDFYTASTHKWLMGPLENGVLYMRKEHIEKIWPNIIGGGWHDNTTTVDDKICFLGQRNDTTTAALPEIISFHETIGRRNIYERVVALNTMLKEQLKKKLPNATFITPVSPSMSGGIVIISVPGVEAKAVVQKMYDTHGIATALTGGVRMSPHIYNTAEDINRVTDALVKSIN
jgi:isopenicillin-N epimerase